MPMICGSTPAVAQETKRVSGWMPRLEPVFSSVAAAPHRDCNATNIS